MLPAITSLQISQFYYVEEIATCKRCTRFTFAKLANIRYSQLQKAIGYDHLIAHIYNSAPSIMGYGYLKIALYFII